MTWITTCDCFEKKNTRSLQDKTGHKQKEHKSYHHLHSQLQKRYPLGPNQRAENSKAHVAT